MAKISFERQLGSFNAEERLLVTVYFYRLNSLGEAKLFLLSKRFIGLKLMFITR